MSPRLLKVIFTLIWEKIVLFSAKDLFFAQPEDFEKLMVFMVL